MSSIKGRVVRLLSGVATRRATVVAVEPIGGFQRLLLRADVQPWAAGTKVQLLLPTDDMRTYTPVATSAGMVLLAWGRAGGPGTRWMSQARAGDELRFVGPQRSLELAAGPAVIVGDETSLGVAAAFAAERPGQLHAVIQTDAAADVRDAAASVGLRQVATVAAGDTASTVDAVIAARSSAPGAVVAVTGRSGLVADVRDALRRAGVQNLKTKTYWIPGKTGLD